MTIYYRKGSYVYTGKQWCYHKHLDNDKDCGPSYINLSVVGRYVWGALMSGMDLRLTPWACITCKQPICEKCFHDHSRCNGPDLDPEKWWKMDGRWWRW